MSSSQPYQVFLFCYFSLTPRPVPPSVDLIVMSVALSYVNLRRHYLVNCATIAAQYERDTGNSTTQANYLHSLLCE
ncbi:hypothetical protein D0Y65_052936 [Glycine soja]|uniref:Uncharacterized protein n=1 Tax=Glycine soja TaxID=3848 RepID=A0A445F092_GLYSO|nr:hypothetical protein D0Y65_052936 [Glycine soja]